MENLLLLPKIEIRKSGKKYRLEWDNQHVEADRVLFEKKDLIAGYIEGYFDALDEKGAKIICLASNTGAIDQLSQEGAEKLKKMLEGLIIPMVEQRYKKLKHDAAQLAW